MIMSSVRTYTGIDELLRLPFGEPIEFLPFDGAIAERARTAVGKALNLIGQYDGALLAELRMLCTDIQLVRDLSAHPDKTVSFSDDSVPVRCMWHRSPAKVILMWWTWLTVSSMSTAIRSFTF